MSKTLIAEIISIGNEILAGHTVNTNATFISQQLAKIGIPVKWVTTISDTSKEINSALSAANTRAQIIVVTGGLGPTPDDITKMEICRYFEQELVENPILLEDLKSFLKKRNRSLDFLKMNRAQAMVPKQAQIIRNNYGTAPGLILKKDESHFIFMPGVPNEMKNMLVPHFLDYLNNTFTLPKMQRFLLRTTGIAESILYDKIKDEVNKYSHIDLSFLPKQIGVDLRFQLVDSHNQFQKDWHLFTKTAEEKLERYIYSKEEKNLPEVLLNLLQKKGATLSVAESFTAGRIQDWVTDIPGSSSVFAGGVVTYSNASKVAMLNVKPHSLNTFGAVSEQVALEMVHGVQELYKTDCAIATTGIAGPGGGSEEKPVGRCYLAARYGQKEVVKEFTMGGTRDIIKMRGAHAALELLRRLILGI